MREIVEPFSYNIEDAEKLTGLGRSKIYLEISAGKLDARKSGRRTVITGASLSEYIAGLPKAKINLTPRPRKAA